MNLLGGRSWSNLVIKNTLSLPTFEDQEESPAGFHFLPQALPCLYLYIYKYISYLPTLTTSFPCRSPSSSAGRPRRYHLGCFKGTQLIKEIAEVPVWGIW